MSVCACLALSCVPRRHLSALKLGEAHWHGKGYLHAVCGILHCRWPHMGARRRERRGRCLGGRRLATYHRVGFCGTRRRQIPEASFCVAFTFAVDETVARPLLHLAARVGAPGSLDRTAFRGCVGRFRHDAQGPTQGSLPRTAVAPLRNARSRRPSPDASNVCSSPAAIKRADRGLRCGDRAAVDVEADHAR